jgi:hypothetical protein
MVGAGGVGAALDWSGVGLTALIIAGVFMLIGAVIGALPKGSFKEGTIEFPNVDTHPRVEKIEAQLSTLDEQLKGQEAASKACMDLLLDYIAAHEPSPNDGRTSRERLADLEQAAAELYSEVAHRQYTGEDYDDGVGIGQLYKWQEEAQRELGRENRRQVARKKFGLPLDDAKHIANE